VLHVPIETDTGPQTRTGWSFIKRCGSVDPTLNPYFGEAYRAHLDHRLICYLAEQDAMFRADGERLLQGVITDIGERFVDALAGRLKIAQIELARPRAFERVSIARFVEVAYRNGAPAEWRALA
jgi:hypothetical protein